MSSTQTNTNPNLELNLAQKALMRGGERGYAMLMGEEIPNTVDVVDRVITQGGPSPLDIDGNVPARGWRPFSRYENTASGDRGILPAAHVHIRGQEEALVEAQGWLNDSIEAAELLSLEGLASSGNMSTLAERIRNSDDAMSLLVGLRHGAYDHAGDHYTQPGGAPWTERRVQAQEDVLSLTDNGLVSYWAHGFKAFQIRAEFWAEQLQGVEQSTRVVELGREVVTRAMQ